MRDDHQKPFSVVQLIKGLAVGILLGAGCLVADFFLGMMLANTRVMFLNALATVTALALIGVFTFRRSRDTGFARGILIALAFSAIIATACGVAMGTGPMRFN